MKEPGFVKIIACCTLLGGSAGAMSGALFGVLWLLAAFRHEPFNGRALGLGFVYGLGIGLIAGFAFGLLNGVAVAAAVKLASARFVYRNSLESRLGYTCVGVSLAGLLCLYPASAELLVLAPGCAALVAISVVGIAWGASRLFCCWYRGVPR